VLSSDTVGSGEAAPIELKGVRSITGRSVRTGDLLPSGVALVTARVRLPAGAPPAGESRSVTLACPAGMKVAGFQSPEQRFPMTYGFQPDTVIGSSTRARIVFGRAVLPRDYDVTVGAFCAKPDADGSLVADPRHTQPGEQAGRVCDSTAYIHRAPGKAFVGTVYEGEPLSILRRDDSGAWARIVSDLGAKGWIKVSALCG